MRKKTNWLCLLKVLATECGRRLKIWTYIPYTYYNMFFQMIKYTEIVTRLPLTEYAWWWSAPVRIMRRLDGQWLFGYKCFQQLIPKLPFNTVHTNATSKSLKRNSLQFFNTNVLFPFKSKVHPFNNTPGYTWATEKDLLLSIILVA